jgi:hypothetical protein
MAGKIERFNSVTGSYTMTNDPAASPKISFGPASGAIVVVDATASGATTINWYTAFTASEQAKPVYVDGTLASTAVSDGQAYPVPDALFAAPFIVGVTDAGTATVRLSVKG